MKQQTKLAVSPLFNIERLLSTESSLDASMFNLDCVFEDVISKCCSIFLAYPQLHKQKPSHSSSNLNVIASEKSLHYGVGVNLPLLITI